MVLSVLFQNESIVLGHLQILSWGTVLWQTTKSFESVSGKGCSSENMHGSEKSKQYFLDMKADLKKSWNLGKFWETTCLVLKAAGVGTSGEVSRITCVGTLQTKRITRFNNYSQSLSPLLPH